MLQRASSRPARTPASKLKHAPAPKHEHVSLRRTRAAGSQAPARPSCRISSLDSQALAEHLFSLQFFLSIDVRHSLTRVIFTREERAKRLKRLTTETHYGGDEKRMSSSTERDQERVTRQQRQAGGDSDGRQGNGVSVDAASGVSEGAAGGVSSGMGSGVSGSVAISAIDGVAGNVNGGGVDEGDGGVDEGDDDASDGDASEGVDTSGDDASEGDAGSRRKRRRRGARHAKRARQRIDDDMDVSVSVPALSESHSTWAAFTLLLDVFVQLRVLRHYVAPVSPRDVAAPEKWRGTTFDSRRSVSDCVNRWVGGDQDCDLGTSSASRLRVSWFNSSHERADSLTTMQRFVRAQEVCNQIASEAADASYPRYQRIIVALDTFLRRTWRWLSQQRRTMASTVALHTPPSAAAEAFGVAGDGDSGERHDDERHDDDEHRDSGERHDSSERLDHDSTAHRDGNNTEHHDGEDGCSQFVSQRNSLFSQTLNSDMSVDVAGVAFAQQEVLHATDHNREGKKATHTPLASCWAFLESNKPSLRSCNEYLAEYQEMAQKSVRIVTYVRELRDEPSTSMVLLPEAALQRCLNVVQQITSDIVQGESQSPQYGVCIDGKLQLSSAQLMAMGQLLDMKKVCRKGIRLLEWLNQYVKPLSSTNPTTVSRIESTYSDAHLFGNCLPCHVHAATSHDFVFVPLHIDKSHWAAVVVDRARTVVHAYDSKGTEKSSAFVMSIAADICRDILPEFDVVQVRNPVQNDGHSFGFFTCLFFWRKVDREVSDDLSLAGQHQLRFLMLKRILDRFG
ncbi:hypothetical protein PybrP1_008280 [[Pythium] brassicae (nom. inval.)]|nr:hypothetical protein PybrP1_008280 [[Pythium] brassicae (nom. inval.)]